MDLLPTDDQLALAEGVRSFLRGRFAPDDVAKAEEAGPVGVIDRDRWRELGEIGVFSWRADGMGAREAVFVFEELGRALVPGPLVATSVAAVLGVAGAADGSSIVGLIEAGSDGVPAIVEHVESLDAALLLGDGEVRLVDAAALTSMPLSRPLDALSPVSAVMHDGGQGGAVVATGDDAARLLIEGRLLTAALSVGVAAAATELAVAYAGERVQFGRPIGSFQAVKHLLAEMFVHTDVARAAVHAAACAVDGASDDDPARAVTAAKLTASEAGLFCGRTGIQVHGGMGFTWAVNAQRYWKRAVVLANTFGTIDDHAEEMSRCL